MAGFGKIRHKQMLQQQQSVEDENGGE